MQDKLRSYMDSLFQDAPETHRAVELKEEILQNLTDKYNDLIAEGKNEEAAYNIAVAGIGDISELIENLKEDVHMPQRYPDEVLQKSKQRSAILVSIAVALYILCVVPCILAGDSVKGPIVMFLMIAVATGLLIFNHMTRIKPEMSDGTVVEEFKEWKAKNSNQRQVYKAISGAIWAVTVAVYFLISFGTMAWYITWVIFLIAAAVDSIVKAIFDLKK